MILWVMIRPLSEGRARHLSDSPSLLLPVTIWLPQLQPSRLRLKQEEGPGQAPLFLFLADKGHLGRSLDLFHLISLDGEEASKRTEMGVG